MDGQNTMKAIISVAAPNFVSVAISILTNLELPLKIACLALTFSYGCWRWWRDIKNSKKNDKE